MALHKCLLNVFIEVIIVMMVVEPLPLLNIYEFKHSEEDIRA